MGLCGWKPREACSGVVYLKSFPQHLILRRQILLVGHPAHIHTCAHGMSRLGDVLRGSKSQASKFSICPRKAVTDLDLGDVVDS